jgi:biopolymer transport protein ExbD
VNFHSSNIEEDANINLTPLIDVVFLLLIFFMVSTTFDTTSQLKINLPEASQEQTSIPPQKLNLLIDAKGNFFINSRELANNKSATLKAALERTMAGN